MKQKIHKTSYKVHRHGAGLYSVTFLDNTKFKQIIPAYIKRVEHGSRNFYHVSKGAPLFPTLRDAIFHVISHW